MTEAQANLSFDHLKRGDRVQVDIHHPRIVALVAAGYLTIKWKEVPDVTRMGDNVDPDLLPAGSDRDLGRLLPELPQETTVTDGTGDDISQPGDPVFEAADETSR